MFANFYFWKNTRWNKGLLHGDINGTYVRTGVTDTFELKAKERKNNYTISRSGGNGWALSKGSEVGEI